MSPPELLLVAIYNIEPGLKVTSLLQPNASPLGAPDQSMASLSSQISSYGINRPNTLKIKFLHLQNSENCLFNQH